ncbi:MAG: hypothetical protein DI544_04275 [Sphingomonas taxi]|uniref:Uncharacterized protein n=1 Tax=Sphingomonas taxi TaxID=1549858 RepID=A0A2W5P7S6_9SPHN|nr:MAG: hypothetical protein DI544_04275 [Sphingomonas taxi]
MATLILTTVGGAIGGPVGAALGGVIGQAVDRNVLLTPRARQGPRLSDLKVQTSSYGTQIPKVFGTMRVAGCVIWATELIETRSTSRAGKGQPSITGYSYAASFAVALSARPIAGVGRIWAEGKLLRGAAGDWKSTTGFRLHHGDEAQAPDPLIAALEAQAPAYRGIAYAVFENLQLADFGNRIPSLTFEVIGDAVTPTIGAVARGLAEGVVAGTGPATPVHGYAASGDSVGGALETLATMAGAWLVPAGGALRLDDAVGAATVLEPDAATRETRRPIETVPRRVSLSCYDPDRDYQIGVQQAQRPGGAGWRDEAIDVPAALPATRARGLAQAAIRRAEQGRVTRRVTLDATAIGFAPGDAVRLPDAPGVWRATRVGVEGRGVTLDLVPVSAGSIELAADPGHALPAPDVRAAATVIVAAELPPLDDARADLLRLAVFVGGTQPGWRGAALLVSGDKGASWNSGGAIVAPAVLGRIATPLSIGTDRLVDRWSTLEVLLAHDDMLLATSGDAALDRGANMALVGSELLQFRDAVQLAPRRWRLSTLWRGRRATPASAHAVDTPFVLVAEDSMTLLSLPRARAGDTIRLLAQGAGDAQPVATEVVLTGISLAPPAPVHLRATADAGGGATMRWARRSRFGWRWDDGTDAPLGEEREAYVVTVEQDGATRSLTTDAPQMSLPAGTLTSGPARLSVRQQGTLAVSAATHVTIEGTSR